MSRLSQQRRTRLTDYRFYIIAEDTGPSKAILLGLRLRGSMPRQIYDAYPVSDLIARFVYFADYYFQA